MLSETIKYQQSGLIIWRVWENVNLIEDFINIYHKAEKVGHTEDEHKTWE